MSTSSSNFTSTATTNTMLAIREKRTNPTDLYHPLRNHISVHYSERQAQVLEADLQTLNKLRSDVDSSTGLPLARRDLLLRYFNALFSMETHFPISPNTTTTFTWFDAFNNKNKSTQVSNLQLEKASVMFNLGAVYSQVGVSFDRSTVEGKKQAVNSFSCAAGAFAYLRDRLALNVAGATVDISSECAGMLQTLMLAQAQECFFENTLAKGTTPALSSKISRQVGMYYEEVNAALVVAPLKGHFDKAWATHVKLKAALFYSEACFRYSLELHEKEEIAEEITRLKTGISALPEKNKRKSSKKSFSKLFAAAIELEKKLNKNLEKALKENDRVYLQRVPLPTSLAALPAISLVKSVSMEDVLSANKEKLFAPDDICARAFSRSEVMADRVIKPQAQQHPCGLNYWIILLVVLLTFFLYFMNG